MSGKMTTRTKGPLIAHDAMSPRKKAASLPKPALGNASNLEDITLERNFLLSLLQQAKSERDQFIETIKEKDQLLKEKDTKLSKLAHRTMAEEQAFRETLSEARSDFDTRLLSRDNKIREREMLICDLVEIVTTAELYAAKSSAAIDIILRTVQLIPLSKYTIESVCRNQLRDIEESDGTLSVSNGHALPRQKKINQLLADISRDISYMKRPGSKSIKRKTKKSQSKSPSRHEATPTVPTKGNQSESVLGIMDPLTSDVEAELSEHSISYSVSDKEDLIAAESSDVQLIPPSKGVGIRSILAGVEESEYSLAVGEEKSSTAAQDQTVENAREISLGSYSESMNSSEAGLSLIRAYQSQQASLSRGSTAFQGNTSNSASFSEHLQLHAHVQEGSYFTLASESGSLTESRKHAKSREVDKSNLPYWWSSLSKPSL